VVFSLGYWFVPFLFFTSHLHPYFKNALLLLKMPQQNFNSPVFITKIKLSVILGAQSTLKNKQTMFTLRAPFPVNKQYKFPCGFESPPDSLHFQQI